jgi:hypothetical protein
MDRVAPCDVVFGIDVELDLQLEDVAQPVCLIKGGQQIVFAPFNV